MKKILVIDDDRLTRQVIEICLRDQDYQLLMTDNGKEGIGLAKTEIPDLIICDVTMPEVDGYEVLQTLRETPATAIIPFIFVTSAKDKEQMRKGMSLGADDYITKPFELAELTEAIRARLEKHEALAKALDALRDKISSAVPAEMTPPLNSILGFSEILLGQLDDGSPIRPDELKDYIFQISSQGKRLLGLVNKFAAFTEASISVADPSRLSELKSQPITDIGGPLSHVADALMEEHARRGEITIKTEKAGLRIDEEHFRRMAEEIIDNALRYTEPGKAIEITGAKEGEEMYLIIFKDKGKGIKKENLELLNTFMEAPGKLYAERGVGLGLAIARIIVEMMGGTFEISSFYGLGCSIKVRLPVA